MSRDLITGIKQLLKAMLTDSMLQIAPTRRCNFHCLHCTHRANEGYLDLDIYKEILARHHKVRMVKLQGLGEPLLHPRIQLLIDIAKDAGHKVMVITNGSLPYVNNVDEYVFSLETVDPTRFDAIGKHNLDRVLANIREAASRQHVSINCVQCSQTTPEDVAAVQAFAGEIGARVWLTPQEVWVDPSHPEHAAQVADTRRAWRIHGTRPDYLKYAVCNWGVSEFYYDYTGAPHPCCIRMTDEYRYVKPCKEICRNCPL